MLNRHNFRSSFIPELHFMVTQGFSEPFPTKDFWNEKEIKFCRFLLTTPGFQWYNINVVSAKIKQL